jgi:hypothetical protein
MAPTWQVNTVIYRWLKSGLSEVSARSIPIPRALDCHLNPRLALFYCLHFIEDQFSFIKHRLGQLSRCANGITDEGRRF